MKLAVRFGVGLLVFLERFLLSPGCLLVCFGLLLGHLFLYFLLFLGVLGRLALIFRDAHLLGPGGLRDISAQPGQQNESSNTFYDGSSHGVERVVYIISSVRARQPVRQARVVNAVLQARAAEFAGVSGEAVRHSF